MERHPAADLGASTPPGAAGPGGASGTGPPPAAGGAFALPGRDHLRDRIVEHLRRVGHDSISGITRSLQREGEAPAHRLTVAGYLQAMTDLGLLKEVARPPNKEYQLANPETHWSLHQRLWRLLQDVPRSDDERIRLLLAALQTILNRPIFAGELLHAGAPRVPDSLDRHVAPDEVRRGYRKLFERRVSPRIDLPQRDALLMLPPTDPALTHPVVQDVVRRLAAKATGADHLVAEKAAAPTQKALDLGGAP